MNTKLIDLIFIALILGFFSYSFVTDVIYPVYTVSQKTELQEISLVEISGNETKQVTKFYPPPSFEQTISAEWGHFMFIFSFAFMGFGVAVPWFSVFTLNFTGIFAYGFLPLFFVILANVSIPLTIKFSKPLPIWRRFFYVWFMASVISLNGMVYWENF